MHYINLLVSTSVGSVLVELGFDSRSLALCELITARVVTHEIINGVKAIVVRAGIRVLRALERLLARGRIVNVIAVATTAALEGLKRVSNWFEIK